MAMIYDNYIAFVLTWLLWYFYDHDFGKFFFNGHDCSQMFYGHILVCALPFLFVLDP